MNITRKVMRDFVQVVLRKDLFYSPVIGRKQFCCDFQDFIDRKENPLTFNEEIEILRSFKKMCGHYISFSTRRERHTSQEYYVIYFNVDPLNQDEWEKFLNEIHYREPEPED